MHQIPQCRAEISRSHTVYVGALIRLAMGAGLNRDASGPKMDPVDCQVRRLLWHQICFLDLLTAEGQGPQPVIRDDEFDTRLPRNINDDAFDRPDNKSVPASGWTDATFSVIRYECCMVHRLISRQRLATDNGQTDLRDLKTVQHLVSVQKLRIEHQYLQYLDEAIPIQRCAKLVGRLFTTRFDAILFHKYSQFDVNTELQIDLRETYVHLFSYRTSSRNYSCVLMLTHGPIASSNPASQYASAPSPWIPTRNSHPGPGMPEHTTNTKGPSFSSWKSTATPIAHTPIVSTGSSITSSEPTPIWAAGSEVESSSKSWPKNSTR